MDRRLIVTDGETLVGGLHSWDLGQWFGGRLVPMTGIGGVAVEPYRGRGVASALLPAAIHDMRERGEPLSAHYPMNHTVYRRRGWEIGGSHPCYAVPGHALAALSRPSHNVTIRWVDEADPQTVRPIADQVISAEPGGLWFGGEAIGRRGFTAGVDVEAHLDIIDPDAPRNADPHVLRVRDGAGTLEPGGQGTTRIGIGALSSIYTGWAQAHRLAAAGRIERATDDDLAALDSAFFGQTPWVRNFF